MKPTEDYPPKVSFPTFDDTALDSLEAQITEVCGHINAATFRFLELVAEFDRTRGWARHGLANCAQWLNWQCGIGACAAREKVRVARAIESLPRISDAFRQGRVSYSKVRAMTRVATPDNEATLLTIALHGTASHVERTVRKFRWVQREWERREADNVHQGRYVRWWQEDDGSWCLRARLAPEVGALVEQAIEAALGAEKETAGEERRLVLHDAPVSAETVNAPGSEPSVCAATSDRTGSELPVSAETFNGSEGEPPVRAETDGTAETGAIASAESSADAGPTAPAAIYTIDPTGRTFSVSAEAFNEPPSPCARRADGLRHMAEQFLAQRSASAGAGANRYQVVVHIAHDALRDAATACSDDSARSSRPLGGAELENGREIAIETARRLACGGSLVGLVEAEDGEPLNIGRKTRAVPPAIQRALRSRDRGCRFPGCDRTRFTHAHHIRHWADGGETSLNNLVTLCSHHHQMVHEGGYDVRKVAGEIEFVAPDGTRIPAAGRNGHWNGSGFRGNSGDFRRIDPGELPLAECNDRHGIAIDAGTASCGWRGERMDYGLAMERLCWEVGIGR